MRSLIRTLILPGIVCIPFLCCDARDDSLSATDILTRTRRVYTTAGHYHDSGDAYEQGFGVWTIFQSLFGRKSIVRFSTDFDRSARTVAFTWDDMHAGDEAQLLALRPASHGTSALAPLLLLGEVQPLHDLTREHDETIHGVRCYVISGRSSADLRTTLWIERQRLVIRRVRRRYETKPKASVWIADYRQVRIDSARARTSP